MKINTLFIALFIALLCSVLSMNTVEATSPGVITSISGTSITNIANKLIPSVLQTIREMPIPNIAEGKLTFEGIHIQELEIQSFSVSTNNQNALVINLSGLYINVRIDKWRYKTKLFSTHGSCTGRGKLSVALAASLVPNGDRFTINLPSVEPSIDEFSIKIGGGILAKILNLIKSIFNGTIRKAVRRAAEPAIRDGLYNVASKLSNSIPTSANTAFGVISFAPAGFGTRYDQNSITVGFNGNINGREPERHAIENTFSPSGKLFDIYVDTFVFNSAFQARNWVEKVYDVDNPGPFNGIKGWTVSDWRDILPGFKNWLDLTKITIKVGMLDSPVMTATNGVLSGRVNAYWDLYAGQTHVVRVKVGIVGGIAVSIQQLGDGKYYIIAQLQAPKLELEQVFSNVGDMDFTNAVVSTIFNTASSLVSSIVNELLSQGILIPSVQGMGLSDPVLTIFNGGFRFGANIDINL
eukprot:UN03785